MTGKVHQKVADFFHRMVKAGEFGIEIEVEGKQLSRGPFKEWAAKDDGSLRGPDNIEYVLKQPLPLDRALKSLDEIVKQNKELGAEYMWSHRCSTHVHVNCTDLDMVQMANFVVSLFIFEKLLVSWCGPWRTGNLFCLTSEDARALIREATAWFKEPNGGVRLGDGIRYSAINLASLPKFGSIELRSLYGTLDKDVLSHWLTALHNIKEFSKKFENPKDIIVAFSKDGPIAIAKDALKEEYGVFFNPKKDEEDLLASVRRAQIIAFATDWDKFCLERERRPVLRVPNLGMRNFIDAMAGAVREEEFNEWVVAQLQQ